MSEEDPNCKLPPRDAAARIGLSHQQLAKMRMRGDGPAFLKLGRKVLYEPAVIDRWLDTKRTTKAPPCRPRGPQRQSEISEQHV